MVTEFVGVGVMVVGGALTEGSAKVAALGTGNSVAYLLGTTWLAIGLSRCGTGHPVIPRAAESARVVGRPRCSLCGGVERTIVPTGRVATLVVLVVLNLLSALCCIGSG